MNDIVESSRRYWEAIGKRLVDIDFEKLSEFARKTSKENKWTDLPTWTWDPYPQDPREYIVQVMYATGGGDACFWTDEGHWYYKNLKGSDGWQLLIKELIEMGKREGKGKDPYESLANWMAELTVDRFRSHLGEADNLQFIEGRVRRLNEMGRVLAECGGDPERILESADWKAYEITRTLRREFPESFGRDYIDSPVGRVRFDKLASLVPILLYEGLLPRGYRLPDMKDATIAADYRVPSAMQHLGILVYDSELAGKILRGEVLEAGGEEEAAIRSATIVAGDRMVKELNRYLGGRVNAAHVDALMFQAGRKLKHFHRVRTLNY